MGKRARPCVTRHALSDAPLECRGRARRVREREAHRRTRRRGPDPGELTRHTLGLAEAAQRRTRWLKRRLGDQTRGRAEMRPYSNAAPVCAARRLRRRWRNARHVSNNPVKYTDPTGHCQFGWDDQGNLIITKDDCTVEEFENNLDWNQRILWLQSFARMHGLGSWFNDITAVLQFFRDDPDFSPAGGWAYRADTAVLQAIQDGWRIKEGKVPIGLSLGLGDATLKISGGQKWATFFQMANDGSATSDDEDVLARLDAEQMGADYAWLTALHLYEAADKRLQNKIGVFKQNADFYRTEFVPGHRNSIFQWRGGIFDPRTADGVVSVMAPALSVSSELGYQFNTCLVIFCQ